MRPRALPGVEIIGMSGCRFAPSVYSERYGIIVCGSEQGGESREIRSRRSRCQPILLEPGEVRACTLTCACVELRALFIEPALFRPFGAERRLAPISCFRMTGAQYAPLVVAAYDLCAAVEQNAPASEQQARLECCLQSMFDLMVEPPPGAHSRHAAVTTARDYVRRRAYETITLDELARVSRMSRFHLLRAFAARIGLPPHAYQTRLRVERAMALLRAGVRPGEVANLTGFADQSHLTRHFRRIMGVTPGEYALEA